MVGNPHLEVLFGGGVVAVFVFFTIIAMRYWMIERSPLGIMMLLGGIVTCALEPFTDFVGLLWFPSANTLFPPIVSGFGVGVPWWVLIGYSWYVGGMSFYAFRQLQRDASLRSVVTLVSLISLADIVLETSGINLGVYTYYGLQPFEVFGFPWWWAMTGGVLCVGIGAIVYKYQHMFNGAKYLLVIAVVPSGFAMYFAWVSWPIWIALDANSGYLLSYAAGAFSMLLAALAIQGIAVQAAAGPIGQRK